MTEQPALIGTGGRVLVSARTGEIVSAFAIEGGRIAAVGTDEEVLRRRGRSTAVIDLAGRTVIPGLIDSHIHAVRAGLTWDLEVRWDGLRSLAAALDVVADAAAERPSGSWLCVLGGWHPGQFSERRLPTRDELDRAAREHPVVAQLLYDGLVANSAALEAAGLAAEGEAAGWVAGMGAIQRCMGAVGTRPVEVEAAATRAFLGQLAAWGVTGVVDAGGFGMTEDRYAPLLSLWGAGDLPIRVRLLLGAATAGGEGAQLDRWLAYLRDNPGDEWLRGLGIGEIALFDCHDGEGLAPAPFTAESRARLADVTRRTVAERRPLHLHAILSSSAEAILDVWEDVAREQPLADLRCTLAHMEQASRRTLERIRALGVGIAVQDRLSLRAADTAAAWGDGAVRAAPPLRTMRELGIPLAAGTDATRVAPPNPWEAIRWFVEGIPLDGGPTRDAAHRLSILEALELYTIGSAWLSGEDDERGQLLPGYRADLAVLSDDCLGCPPEHLPGITAALTLVGGKVAAGQISAND